MSNELPRLSLNTLARTPQRINLPTYDPACLRTGIVHLGVGAFHRAHQAALTDDATDIVEGGWGIVGVTQRSRTVIDQLAPQDGLYTLAIRAGTTTRIRRDTRVVGSIRRVLQAGIDAGEVTAALADPNVRLVSTTVTEKGYAADLRACTLDTRNPAVRADLTDARPHRSVIGQLVAGFTRRAEAGHDGVTVLCCDNIDRGGDLLAALCGDFLQRWTGGPATDIHPWMWAHVRFPNCLVDRIVPATTNADRQRYERLLGYRDEGLVTAEPYRLWVVEDDFANGHPRWPQEHVKLVHDVRPWSDVKLRLLNGGHSLLAYLGMLDERDTVSEATEVPEIERVLERWFDEASASLTAVPDGLDLAAYRATLRQRFANPSIAHWLDQIAVDGSIKLPVRVLPVARRLAERGERAPVAAFIVACWLRTLEKSTSAPADPAGSRLSEALTKRGGARHAVTAALGNHGALPISAPLQGTFLDDVATMLERLRRDHPRILADRV